MSDWFWVSKNTVLGAHALQIEIYGGGRGLRDEGLLESALSRPENLAHYGEPSVFELAAAYAYGLARNHPFVDGNKRIAFVTAVLFLEKNGQGFVASEVEATMAFLRLAAGEIEEAELAAWFRDNSRPV